MPSPISKPRVSLSTCYVAARLPPVNGPHVGLNEIQPPLAHPCLLHFWPRIFHSIFPYSGNSQSTSLPIPYISFEGGGRGHEPAGVDLCGGAMYHGATAVYLSTTPAHRNLGSLLTGLKPLPKTQGLCITATPNMDSEDVESLHNTRE